MSWKCFLGVLENLTMQKRGSKINWGWGEESDLCPEAGALAQLVQMQTNSPSSTDLHELYNNFTVVIGGIH